MAKLPKLEQEYTGVNPDTGEYMSPAERKIAFAKRTGKDVRKMPKMSSTTVGGAFGGMKGGAIVKQDRLFKVEQEIGEANKSLVEIRSILEKDFERKIEQDKDEIADLQASSNKAKLKKEEKSLESKNLGDKIKGNAEKALSPVKGMKDKLIELLVAMSAGFLGNAAFEFLKAPGVRDAWKSISKFLIKQFKWVSATIAAFFGFTKPLRKLIVGFYKGYFKVLKFIWKNIFKFVKSLFGLPKRIGKVFKGIGAKIKNIASKVADIGKTIGSIIEKVKNFLKGGVGKVLGFGKNLFKKGKNLVKTTSSIVKSSAKNIVKSSGKNVAKTTVKATGKGAGKSILKKIPFVGLGLGAAFAVDRLRGGDWAGALMELGSGAASMIPGVGTAISTGLDLALIAKDIGDAKKNKEGEVTPAKTGRGVTKGQRLIVGEKGPEILEAPFTGTVKHNTETMNTLKSEDGDGVVVVTENLPPMMSKPPEVGEEAGEKANPSQFIASMNKMNDYMKTTPEVLGMTL